MRERDGHHERFRLLGRLVLAVGAVSSLFFFSSADSAASASSSLALALKKLSNEFVPLRWIGVELAHESGEIARVLARHPTRLGRAETLKVGLGNGLEEPLRISGGTAPADVVEVSMGVGARGGGGGMTAVAAPVFPRT